MNNLVGKTQSDRNQQISSLVAQKQKKSKSLFQFVDNRSTAIAQKKRQAMVDNSPKVQRIAQLQIITGNQHAKQQPITQKKENNTGLPDHLKSGIENISGYSMDDVKVHYNSDKPAQLQAHAYAKGTDIHIGPGQEKHLAHEAWHVVQQKQGRVKPTAQLKGKTYINDDSGLEKEADVMGSKSLIHDDANSTQLKKLTDPNNQVIQRVTLAVGELQELNHHKTPLTHEAHDQAKIITDAEKSYRQGTGESQVHPWDERNRLLLNFGPLNTIGSENLRIFGHGQVYEGDKSVSKIGGYSPAQLSHKLIELGLPAKYTGEIYLSGCETAVGHKRGYLGIFYQMISQHSKGVRVRGNLGVTTTHKDGVQGVWTGVMSEHTFNKTRNSLVAKEEFYLQKNKEIIAKSGRQMELQKALEEEREALLAKPSSNEKVDDFLMRYQKFNQACLANEAAAKEMNEYIKMINNGINELDYIAYDRSGRLSVTLPTDLHEKVNIKAALADAKKAEEFRLTKLEIAEEMASIYGWAESVVTRKVYSGELDERAHRRIQSNQEDTPSYIS